MPYDVGQAYGWGQNRSAGTGGSCDTAHMHEYRLVSIAVTRPPLETPAQRAIDRLLREYLDVARRASDAMDAESCMEQTAPTRSELSRQGD